MSSRTACSLVILLLASCLYAQDWEGFAASSDRSQDLVILQTMATGELSVNIALCKGLGRRPDTDVHVFINSLVAGHASRTSLETEILLRWLITSAQDANASTEALRAWSSKNAGSVDVLLDRITDWKSAQLKGALLAFAVIADGAQGLRAIADVGAEIVQELDHSRGLIPSEDSALAMDFLAAARSVGRVDFFPFCTDIARLSRDRVLVSAARSTALFLSPVR